MYIFEQCVKRLRYFSRSKIDRNDHDDDNNWEILLNDIDLFFRYVCRLNSGLMLKGNFRACFLLLNIHVLFIIRSTSVKQTHDEYKILNNFHKHAKRDKNEASGYFSK
jgi:fibrillarin-like rRNA methylase